MIATEISPKCSVARRSITPRTNDVRSAALHTRDFLTAIADCFESGSEKRGDERIQTQLNVLGAPNKRTPVQRFPDGAGPISLDSLAGAARRRLLGCGLVLSIGLGVGWLHHLGPGDGPMGP
jgi:hypothetical protein